MDYSFKQHPGVGPGCSKSASGVFGRLTPGGALSSAVGDRQSVGITDFPVTTSPERRSSMHRIIFLKTIQTTFVPLELQLFSYIFRLLVTSRPPSDSTVTLVQTAIEDFECLASIPCFKYYEWDRGRECGFLFLKNEREIDLAVFEPPPCNRATLLTLPWNCFSHRPFFSRQWFLGCLCPVLWNVALFLRCGFCPVERVWNVFPLASPVADMPSFSLPPFKKKM